MATSPTSATPTTMDDRATSVLVRFTPASATTEQYDETIRRLEKSGDWLPEGLELHVAFEAGGKFRVSEIWDSQAQFDAFGKHLMPILEDVGIDPGAPEMLEIHNIIRR
ncbi:MAG TPA: hypothetical protein VNF91_10655 [Candidatus Acidoferrum sp.]|jgi:hypothetical protein|nr:hypothetical protein [Candidatus Acidoferrum sp.]